MTVSTLLFIGPKCREDYNNFL